MNQRASRILLGVVALVVLAVAVLYFPSFYRQHLAWRLDNLQTIVYYLIHPPQKVVFVPGQQSRTATAGPPTAQPTSLPTPLPTDLATPTVTSTPLPTSVVLQNITFIDQMHRWNYCGPANMSMALEYWGWKGVPGDTSDLRDQIAFVVKPGADNPDASFIDNGNTDVNVMPYELVDYVNDHTTLKALYRYGGDLDLVKHLIAAGFPIIAEKGIYQALPPENTLQWAGHYAFTTGYDDSQQVFTWQDSYTPNDKIPPKDQGYNVKISYADYLSNWRAFNYLFIIVYPADKQDDLYQVLGPWADATWADQHALAIAQQESQSLTGLDQFFATFNEGTSYNQLADYGSAATAYDQAFSLYNNMAETDRPYRIMWYETGPYFAYYYTSRFQDVIDLANTTLATIDKPRSLEESLYWRALAEYAIGQTGPAVTDIKQAYYYNRYLPATLQIMQQWGVTP
ncbi:MAG: C39 family peptidase [Anaerolineales bacterium]